MPDNFRYYGLLDVRRMANLMAVELAWLRDLRHSVTESMENEKARTRELSEAFLKFNNERLAPTTGDFWVPREGGPPPARLEGVVTRGFVMETLKRELTGRNIRYILLDDKFSLCDKAGVSLYLGWSTIDKLPYKPNDHDCDDFAFEVFGEFSRFYQFGNIGVVIDWSSGHAYSFAIFADGTVWWIEPQNDRQVKIGNPPYKLESAWLVMG